MKKIFIRLLFWLSMITAIFTGCGKNETVDIEDVLQSYHNGRILQGEWTAEKIDNDTLIKFFYYNNEKTVRESYNYIVPFEVCKEYLSEWFDITDMDLGGSVYNADNNLLDLHSYAELDSLRTEYNADTYKVTDNTIEIIYKIRTMIGDDENFISKTLKLEITDKGYKFISNKTDKS